MDYRQYQQNDCELIGVRWEEITRFLGRPHEGTPEDDEAVVAELLAEGAPSWIKDDWDESGIDELEWWTLKRLEE